MKKYSKVIFLALLVICVFIDIGHSKNYVSLSGRFYVDVPENWEIVDYNLVDLYLSQNKVGREGFYYDCVLAPKENKPFYNGNYVLITYDIHKEFTDEQIDSVLQQLSRTFGNDIKYFPAADYLTDLKSNTPVYDKDQKVAYVINEITQKSESYKKNLLFYKFYHRGIAKFYFYSPDSLFEQSKPVFEKIISSFSNENIEAALPKEKVEVADIKTESNEGETKTRIIPYAVLITLIFIIIVVRKKRKKANS